MQLFIKSLKYAVKGVKISIHERNMKIHLFLAFLAVLLGFFLKISAIKWSIILLCIASVLSLEILNTAIEHLVDLACPHQDKRAEKIKDLAAGAVLVFSIFALMIGALIFYEPIIDFMNTMSIKN